MGLSCSSTLARLSPSLQNALIVPFGLLAVCSTLLNVVVVGLFLKEKSLRTFSNAFYMSLVVSDFLIASVFTPLTVVQLSLPSKMQSCTVNRIHSLAIAFLAAPMLTISAIAYERAQHIAREDKYMNFMTTWRKVCLLAAPWITPVIFIISRLFEEKVVSWIVFGIFFSSYTLLVCSYINLIRFLGKRQVELNQFDDSDNQKYLREKIHKRNKKVTRLIFSMIIAFISCTVWIFLYRILLTVHMYKPKGFRFIVDHGPILFAICLFLIQFNSALNPILYFVKHQQIRQSLLRVLRRRRGVTRNRNVVNVNGTSHAGRQSVSSC